jgi:antitoxin PrlF
MSATAPALPASKQIAKVTSKGQITSPAETRGLLGVKPGDRLTFERKADGEIVVHKAENVTIEVANDNDSWLPPGYEGREGVIRYFRELRGHDEIDDLIFGTKP